MMAPLFFRQRPEDERVNLCVYFV